MPHGREALPPEANDLPVDAVTDPRIARKDIDKSVFFCIMIVKPSLVDFDRVERAHDCAYMNIEMRITYDISLWRENAACDT
jgi:hypothetical protein